MAYLLIAFQRWGISGIDKMGTFSSVFCLFYNPGFLRTCTACYSEQSFWKNPKIDRRNIYNLQRGLRFIVTIFIIAALNTEKQAYNSVNIYKKPTNYTPKHTCEWFADSFNIYCSLPYNSRRWVVHSGIQIPCLHKLDIILQDQHHNCTPFLFTECLLSKACKSNSIWIYSFILLKWSGNFRIVNL